MNTPQTKKNIAIYNNQPLDSYSDTVISFEYSRYNPIQTPTGGFAVVFFDSIIDKPREGGPGYCLGYTPSNITTDRCRLEGYKGLAGALLGVGFDSLNRFALETDLVDGIPLAMIRTEPSITIRGGISDKFNLLYSSASYFSLKDFTGIEGFTIDKQQETDTIDNYRSVRIIVSKQFSEITVQLKKSIQDVNFITVAKLSLKDRPRKSFKVAITSTTDDPNTVFLLRNFNVAGFPSEDQAVDVIEDCLQNIRVEGRLPESFIAMGKEYISLPVEKRLVTYTTDLNVFSRENIIYSGAGVRVLGNDKNNVVGKINNTNEVVIYQYLGQKLAKTTSIFTPDGAEAASADLYENTLVICTEKNEFFNTPGGIFIYKLVEDSTNSTLLGTYLLYQKILPKDVVDGENLGWSVQVDGDNLIVGNKDETLHVFEKVNDIWVFKNNIFSPLLNKGKFSSVISLYGRDLMVGAPYATRPSESILGKGEVYHYFLSRTTNTWNYIMALGSFYGINSIAGNFGTDVKINENLCVVGCPGEAFLEGNNLYESPNVGRAYIFNKTLDGIFTQGSVITPLSSIREKYMFFGQSVNVYGKFVAITAPFTPQRGFSYLNIYNTQCFFTSPPTHLPIPDCSIGLIDSSGYMIDLQNFTYMESVSCKLNT